MLNQSVIIIFQIVILVMSVVIHEVAHGLAAFWQGDLTAKYAGRLTLNPLKHLDPWGSVVVPFIMVMLFGFPFGWAKPVPYNPYNLRDQKIGPALVGLSGPLSNIIVALIFGLGARFLAVNFVMKREIILNLFSFDYASLTYSVSGSLAAVFFLIFSMIALINIFLAFFNLIPIPPLDGSKLLFAVLSLKTETAMMLEQFGFIILMFVIFFMSTPIGMFLSFVRNIFFIYVVGIS